MNAARDHHDLEDRIRAALAEQANIITPATLRRPELPRPRRRSQPAPLIAAALVAALLIGGSIGIAAFRIPESVQAFATRVPSVTVGAELPASDGYVDIDGAHIPVPPGWTATELQPIPGARQLCLTDVGEPDDTCASGMFITIAVTVDGHIAHVITAPPDLCPGARQYMTYDGDATVGGRPAGQYEIWCDDNKPRADYWQLPDQTLTIATPLSEHPDIYTRIVADIDLTGWTHQP